MVEYEIYKIVLIPRDTKKVPCILSFDLKSKVQEWINANVYEIGGLNNPFFLTYSNETGIILDGSTLHLVLTSEGFGF
jgi:hypothetical protein